MGKKGAPVKKKKEKNKMEQLLDEFMEQGLDPTKTVVCQLELPRGRGAITRWHPRFEEDLRLTLNMVCCNLKFNMMLSGENKVMITFEDEEEKKVFDSIESDKVAKLEEETGIAVDLPNAAHFIDLYG